MPAPQVKFGFELVPAAESAMLPSIVFRLIIGREGVPALDPT
jgi:hypothetical protein